MSERRDWWRCARIRYPYDRFGVPSSHTTHAGCPHMIDVDYPQLLTLFPEHRDPKRTESASFLIWYLEHYYRLDTQEAIDAVCDQKGDRGVDGIFVDDNAQTITIFQSRISQ